MRNFWHNANNPSSVVNGSKDTKRKCVQMHLDVGQKEFFMTKCKDCGMVYAKGNKKDEELHHEQHRKSLVKLKNVDDRLTVYKDESRTVICLSLPENAVFNLQVQGLCKQLECELGLDSYWLLSSRKVKVYLCLTVSKQVLGMLIAEEVSTATLERQCFEQTSKRPSSLQSSRAPLEGSGSSNRQSGSIKPGEKRIKTSDIAKLWSIKRPCNEVSRTTETAKAINAENSSEKSGLTTFMGELVQQNDQGPKADVAEERSGNDPGFHEASLNNVNHPRKLVNARELTRDESSMAGDLVKRPEDVQEASCADDTSASSCDVDVGIRLVWIAPSFRRKGCASLLANIMRANFIHGYVVPLERVALSTVTCGHEGKLWAQRYLSSHKLPLY